MSLIEDLTVQVCPFPISVMYIIVYSLSEWVHHQLIQQSDDDTM